MKSVLVVVLGVVFLASSVTCCKRAAITTSEDKPSLETENTQIKPENMPNEWPSLVGKKGEEAQKFISKERPELKIVILNKDDMMTMDFREDRVRIFVDDNQVVVRPPKTG
ncbi:uncharacterized protein [Antedon mediterranea]|uniref:uncharacterized protein isoform X1 n=1 Tax=Antedon mediterranea TaxID=105859 RepID=UPI003AF56221